MIDGHLHELSGPSLKVYLYIWRKTAGWRKKSDTMTLAQVETGLTTRTGKRLDYGTGLSRRTVLRALRDLETRGLVAADRHSGKPSTYRLLPVPPMTPVSSATDDTTTRATDGTHKEDSYKEELNQRRMIPSVGRDKEQEETPLQIEREAVPREPKDSELRRTDKTQGRAPTAREVTEYSTLMHTEYGGDRDREHARETLSPLFLAGVVGGIEECRVRLDTKRAWLKKANSPNAYARRTLWTHFQVQTSDGSDEEAPAADLQRRVDAHPGTVTTGELSSEGKVKAAELERRWGERQRQLRHQGAGA